MTRSRIATICARGGSKGLPGKNLLPFPGPGGKPLIVHSIEQALACPLIDGVFVSTDAPEIAAVATAAGAVVPGLRPVALATDSAPKLPALEHLVEQVESLGRHVDEIVDLQPTSPLRVAEDIVSCVKALETGGEATDLVITGSSCGFNPWFNMVAVKPDGSVQLAAKEFDCTRPLSGGKPLARRQDAPTVWGMNGSIYVWKRQALRQAAVTGLWSVRVKGVEMPRERSVDIDDALDWDLAAWFATRAGFGPRP